MQNDLDIAAKLEALREALDKAHGVRGKSFEVALRRAGRLLPRRVRSQAQQLVAAERMGGNPKLERRLDRGLINRAYREVLTYLEGVDRADLRRGRLLDIAGTVAFNLLVVAVGVLIYLYWRGFV